MSALAVDETARLRRLIQTNPWYAMATCDEHGPYGAMVAIVWDATQRCGWLHISKLAAHTRHLLARPQACLVLSEPAIDVADPQTLLRVSVNVDATVVPRDDGAYGVAYDIYCARLPASARLFDFGDFVLFRAIPRDVRAVFGFGRALKLAPDDWLSLVTT